MDQNTAPYRQTAALVSRHLTFNLVAGMRPKVFHMPAFFSLFDPSYENTASQSTFLARCAVGHGEAQSTLSAAVEDVALVLLHGLAPKQKRHFAF